MPRVGCYSFGFFKSPTSSPECAVELRGVLANIVAYFLGAIPFGYLIVRAKSGADIRQTGSGGTGATNVSRRAGKFAAALTLLLDSAKGAAAVLIAKWLVLNQVVNQVGNGGLTFQVSSEWWVAAAGLAVMLGHIFPVWLKFRGGKGVATGCGVFLVLMPAIVLFAALIFVAVVFSTRYVSLGSIIAALAIPILLLLQHVLVRPLPNFSPLVTFAVASALLIVFAHRENISRLVQGRETRFL